MKKVTQQRLISRSIKHGKTYKSIMFAHEIGGTIVCKNKQSEERIKRAALKIGVEIKTIIIE